MNNSDNSKNVSDNTEEQSILCTVGERVNYYSHIWVHT